MSERLDEVRKEIASIDAAGLGADPARYRADARQCGELPSPVELSRLFQVDMVKQAQEAVLGGSVLDEIGRGVGILRRLARPRRSEDLTRFREAFVLRYEGREISLVEALDEEVGIGYPPASGAAADRAPLLKNLAFPDPSEETSPWGAWERFRWTRSPTRRPGFDEIVLEERDVRSGKIRCRFQPRSRSARRWPPRTRRRLRVGIFVSFGMDARPSGADCWADFAMPIRASRVRQRHLRAEEALEPRRYSPRSHSFEGRPRTSFFSRSFAVRDSVPGNLRRAR